MEKMPVALPDAFAVDPAGAHCDQCDTEEDPEDGIILSGDGQTRKQGLPAFWRTRLRCQIPHPRSGERGYAAESCSRVRQNAGGRLMSLSLFSASLSLFGRSLSPFGQSLSPFGQSLSPFGRHYHQFDLIITGGVDEMITTVFGRAIVPPSPKTKSRTIPG